MLSLCSELNSNWTFHCWYLSKKKHFFVIDIVIVFFSLLFWYCCYRRQLLNRSCVQQQQCNDMFHFFIAYLNLYDCVKEICVHRIYGKTEEKNNNNSNSHEKKKNVKLTDFVGIDFTKEFNTRLKSRTQKRVWISEIIKDTVGKWSKCFVDSKKKELLKTCLSLLTEFVRDFGAHTHKNTAAPLP